MCLAPSDNEVSALVGMEPRDDLFIFESIRNSSTTAELR